MSQSLSLVPLAGQHRLPLQFDAPRAADCLRARIYHDPRLSGLTMVVAIVVAEFAHRGSYACHLKAATVCYWSHASERRVRGALVQLEELGVLSRERQRTYQRFVFETDWLERFGPLARPDNASGQDRTIRPVSGEPIDTEPPEADTEQLPFGREHRARGVDGFGHVARQLRERNGRWPTATELRRHLEERALADNRVPARFRRSG